MYISVLSRVNNPIKFRGIMRPVENLSFLGKINEWGSNRPLREQWPLFLGPFLIKLETGKKLKNFPSLLIIYCPA